MKNLSTLIIGVALTLFVSSAFADDLNPPPWRGESGSTFQEWEFLTDANASLPDDWFNPYGLPIVGVAPNPVLLDPWLPDVEGHLGVWSLSGAMAFSIPNTPNPDPWVKTVWLQITWQDTQGFPATGPTLGMADPNGDPWALTLVNTIDLGDGWCSCTYTGRIEPNPRFELIGIGGNIDVDQVVIDTICDIPEPGNYALLFGAGLLGFSLWRRMRA